jgi:hypothetical protein
MLSNICEKKKEIYDFGKEIYRLALGLRNLWKIQRLAAEFCFFVNSVSGNS